MKILVILAFIFAACGLASAQSAARSITSDDFVKSRPSEAGAGKKQDRVTYTFVRKEKNPLRRKPPRKPVRPTKPPANVDLGVTIWRLRPPKSSDTGVKLPVNYEGKQEFWTSERVALDTIFVTNDRVRLAVEPTTSGFLYVINNELHSDGTLGDPCLLFPETLDDSNSVAPGMLVDFPDRTEAAPYFKINPRSPKYSGELLTFIVSPTKLPDLKTVQMEGCLRVNIEKFVDGADGADVEIFTSPEKPGSTLTAAEADSACGAKQRGLEREKNNAKPCVNSRNLTREEPAPQSILRVNSDAGKPTIAFIRLNVKH